jgi:hypothetical protein
LGREVITGANVATALEEVSGRRVRGAFLRAIKQGKAHYKEEYVLRRLFEMALCEADSFVRGQAARV